MTLAGLPAATTFAGISDATTLPAPMTLFSPMVTPLQTFAPSPIQTFCSRMTGRVIPTTSVRS